jgi:hypothetical protein
MRRLGFKYQSVDLDVPMGPGADLGPAAYAEQFGFGISMATGQQVQEAPGDPNLGYAGSLPAEDRAAYLTALLGGPAEGASTGCRPIANDAVYGFRERILAGLRPDLEALASAVRDDPAISAAETEWSSCMIASGHPVGSHAELDSYIATTIRASYDLLQSEPSEKELQQLQELERQVAKVVIACDAPWMTTLQTLRDRYAQPFVASHRTELEEIRDSILARHVGLMEQYGVSPGAQGSRAP